FVVDNFGCKCVSHEPWVTVAETAELVMALVKVGRKNQAKEILSWLDKYRDKDGSYWMGYQTEHKMNWPLEKPPWTSGAVILATDAVFDITPASKLFSQ
ncbi:MAG: prenyltransferase, partial [Pseudomonadota bacterium]|nr:prenyltransferase [Pseudomonadota bacterium]